MGLLKYVSPQGIQQNLFFHFRYLLLFACLSNIRGDQKVGLQDLHFIYIYLLRVSRHTTWNHNWYTTLLHNHKAELHICCNM